MCIFCVLCLSVYESISRAPSIFVRPDESFFFSLSLPLPCPFLFFFFNRFFFRRHHAACLSANSAEEAMWEFICPTSTLAPCPPSPPVRSYTCHRLLFFFCFSFLWRFTILLTNSLHLAYGVLFINQLQEVNYKSVTVWHWRDLIINYFRKQYI